MISCGVCDHEVSEEAKACPKCGHPLNMSPFQKGWREAWNKNSNDYFGTLFVSFFVFYLIIWAWLPDVITDPHQVHLNWLGDLLSEGTIPFVGALVCVWVAHIIFGHGKST
jgi:hypothetical protein